MQTLMRRTPPPADVVLIDEAHRWFEWYGKWFAHPDWQKTRWVGLSATPWTRGLGKHFDELIVAATTGDLIEKGHLCPFKVMAPSHPDLTGVKTVAGDYREDQLAAIMGDAKLVADVVDTWREHGQDRPTFCFAVDRAHARKLAEAFAAAGVATEYMDAFTSREERLEIRGRFHSGETRIVCNVGVLTTGIDWDVRCLSLARPTKSEILFCQIVGRGLRTAPGKLDCLILDHTDTHLKLGMVTDIHHASLDGGTERKKAPGVPEERLPRECPSCRFLMAATSIECPNCGFVIRKQSMVVSAPGNLTWLERRSAGRADRTNGALSFVAELYGYAHLHGKSGSWVQAMYKNKFKTWVPAQWQGVTPIQPSPETIAYIRSRNIAWAKSREKLKRELQASLELPRG